MMISDLVVVNWAEPSAFTALQVPAFGLALWLAWRLALSYVADGFGIAREVADYWLLGMFKKSVIRSFKLLFYAFAGWLCCGGVVGVGAGLLGLEPATDLLAWQVGGAALLPVVALAEHLKRKEPDHE